MSKEPFPMTEAANLLSLMSNSARLQIFRIITQKEWDVGALAKEVHLSQSALSQHLRKLREGRLVNVRRHQQTLFYSSDHAGVLKILDALDRMYNRQSDEPVT